MEDRGERKEKRFFIRGEYNRIETRTTARLFEFSLLILAPFNRIQESLEPYSSSNGLTRVDEEQQQQQVEIYRAKRKGERKKS